MADMASTSSRDRRRTASPRVTLNRPELHNAFDDALIAELTAALRATWRATPAVRVVVLAGNGQSFSAGADLNWMQRMAGYGRRREPADARRSAT